MSSRGRAAQASSPSESSPSVVSRALWAWRLALVLAAAGWAGHAWAAPPAHCEPPDVLLVVDFSGSMTVGMNGTQNGKPSKVDVLRQAYQDILNRFDKRIRFGLITFTTSTNNGPTCATQQPNIQLQVGVGPNTAQRCISALNVMRANGCTPMLPALLGAQNHYQSDVIPRDSVKARRRFVVLLTDGVPNTGCPGYKDPKDSRACGRHLKDQVQKLRSTSVGGQLYDIKTYVIGFGQNANGSTSVDPQNLNDMAAAGGTGKYFQANDLAQLRKALETIANNAGGKVEVCNGIDDNCDGTIDEGIVVTCQGACGAGKRLCKNGKLTDCSAPATKGNEVCNNIDDDCNGKVDDGLERDCPKTNNCGQQGKARCEKGQWVGCTGDKTPPEVCDGKDNNCDGRVDEGLSQPCQTNCGTGERACIQGDWSTCTAPRPAPEVCNGIDDDCDGTIDEGAPCHGKCVGGVCYKSCQGGECPSGQECGVDGLCVEKGCEPVCSLDKTCLRGYCVPKDCRKPGGACRSHELCRGGTCVRNSCQGVACDAGQFCRVGPLGKGVCVISCANVPCSPSQQCVDGTCVENPCAGKTCSVGQACRAGVCVAKSGCPKQACSDTQTCVDGICVDDLCAGVTCPGTGGQCRNGQCYGSQGPLVRDPNTGKVYPRNKPGGPTDPKERVDGDAGDGPRPDRPGTPPGCDTMCSASGFPTHAPVFLICLLLLLPWLIRRKQ